MTRTQHCRTLNLGLHLDGVVAQLVAPVARHVGPAAEEPALDARRVVLAPARARLNIAIR